MIHGLLWSVAAVMIMPIDSIPCKNICHTITTFRDRVYGAPFTGQTVYTITEDHDTDQITFTDDPLFLIKNFRITPFALYVNNGYGIIRYSRSKLTAESMIESDNICCFDITPEEEIVYADQTARSVFFLDFTGEPIRRIEDLAAYDLKIHRAYIYVLSRRSLTLWDEHGNRKNKISFDQGYNGMYVHNGSVFLFVKGQRDLYIISPKEDISYTLSHAIQDISGIGAEIYILNDTGTLLYIYNFPDF